MNYFTCSEAPAPPLWHGGPTHAENSAILLLLQLQKSTQKQHHLQTGFQAINYVTDHVIGIPRGFPECCSNWVVVTLWWGVKVLTGPASYSATLKMQNWAASDSEKERERTALFAEDSTNKQTQQCMHHSNTVAYIFALLNCLSVIKNKSAG